VLFLALVLESLVFRVLTVSGAKLGISIINIRYRCCQNSTPVVKNTAVCGCGCGCGFDCLLMQQLRWSNHVPHCVPCCVLPPASTAAGGLQCIDLGTGPTKFSTAVLNLAPVPGTSYYSLQHKRGAAVPL
jgi:hypothetical protein